MEYITLTRQRNQRLTRAFREAMARKRLDESVSSVLSRVVNSPVERGYFVGVDHVIVMDRRRREGKLPRMTEKTALMWREIFSHMDAYRAANPRATIVDSACAVVGTATASRFFLTEKTAKSIIKREQL